MAIVIYKNSGKLHYGVKHFVCDDAADVQDLPVTEVWAGSTAEVIATGEWYKFNTNNEWIKVNIGQAGTPGANGKAATIQIGEVTTGAPSSEVSVTNVGTNEAAIFNFSIPRGYPFQIKKIYNTPEDMNADFHNPDILPGELVATTENNETVVYVKGNTQYEFFFSFAQAVPIKGDAGAPGEKGDKGDKGEAFIYDDFTPEQLAALKGADGADGRGIASITASGAVATVTYDDGTTNTFLIPEGPQGDGITSITQGQDGTITITVGESDTYTVEALQGEDGNGIDDVTDLGDGSILITMTDGTEYTITGLKGPTGSTGATGATGPAGPQGPKGDPMSFKEVYDTTQDMEDDHDNPDILIGDLVIVKDGKVYVKTELDWTFICDISTTEAIQGPKGDTGATGPQGEEGPAGPGITDIELDQQGQLIITVEGGDTYTIDFGDIWMRKVNPVGTGTMSMNRKASTGIGNLSATFNYDCEASGLFSFAEGDQTIASGARSHAEGCNSKAQGSISHAEGNNTTVTSSGYNGGHAEGNQTTVNGTAAHAEGTRSAASGDSSHAEGYNTITTGTFAHAEGAYTTASGRESHAEGLSTVASGYEAHAEGNNTQAIGSQTHAEGRYTVASGEIAHAENDRTIASGYGSHAEGGDTKATESYAHAEGKNTTASAFAAHAEGASTEASGREAHAEGENTVASGYDAHSEGINTIASGPQSHAEGSGTVSSGQYTHTEGGGTKATAQGAHAEGNGTTASNIGAHAEGNGTKAEGYGSHAEGQGTITSGYGSHSEGSGTTASGNYTHAEGRGTKALGDYSHAEGCETIANGYYQHVQGKYNIEDTNNIYAEIVGGGANDSNRSNIRTLDWNGNETIAGTLYASAIYANGVPVGPSSVPTNISYFENDVGYQNTTGVNNLIATALENFITDAYDSTASYEDGEYCIYNNTLYRCIAMEPTTGDFDPNDWEPTTVAEELLTAYSMIDALSTENTAIAANLAPAYHTNQAYAVGDLIMKNYVLYQCNTAISLPGEAWTPAHWTQTTLASLLINGNNIQY